LSPLCTEHRQQRRPIYRLVRSGNRRRPIIGRPFPSSMTDPPLFRLPFPPQAVPLPPPSSSQIFHDRQAAAISCQCFPGLRAARASFSSRSRCFIFFSKKLRINAIPTPPRYEAEKSQDEPFPVMIFFPPPNGENPDPYSDPPLSLKIFPTSENKLYFSRIAPPGEDSPCRAGIATPRRA